MKVIYVFAKRIDQVDSDPLTVTGLYLFDDTTNMHHQIGYVSDVMGEGRCLIKCFEKLFEMECIDNNDKLGLICPEVHSLGFLKRGFKGKLTKNQTAIKDILDGYIKTLKVQFRVRTTITKDDYTNYLYADCSAERAVTAFKRGKLDVVFSSATDKDMKRPAKIRPKLLKDKFLFNWEPTEVITLASGAGGKLYYTGNGHADKSASKKDKLKDTTLVDNSYVYYTGSNSRLKSFGMRSAEERRNVVILKDPVPAIDNLMEYQDGVNASLETRPIVMGRIADILGPGCGGDAEEGEFSNVGSTNVGDLYRLTLRRMDLTYVCNPPRLGPRIRDSLIENKLRLLAHINNQNLDGVGVTDVTDMLYTTSSTSKPPTRKMLKDDPDAKPIVTTKSVLLPHIKSNTDFTTIPNVVYDGGSVKLKLLFEYDMPTVAVMKSLAGTNPKVEILTRKTDTYEVSFAVVITTDEGWLYHNGLYSSKFLLRGASASLRKGK